MMQGGRQASRGRVVVVMIVGGLVFAAGALLQAIPSLAIGGEWRALLEVVALFGVTGLLYGLVAALDSKSPLAVGNYPLLRTLSCGAVGGLLVLLVWWRWPGALGPEWVVAGTVAGGLLGRLGWRWAKYVDF
jgi:hypothetical protein